MNSLESMALDAAVLMLRRCQLVARPSLDQQMHLRYLRYVPITAHVVVVSSTFGADRSLQ